MLDHKTAICTFLAATMLVGCQAESPTGNNANFARAWCLSGGKIYTANDQTPTVEAVAIRKGVITYAGPDEGKWCANAAGGNSTNINLRGATAYPGFTDAHGHLLGIGLREMTLNLEGTTSIEDLKSRLADVAAKTQDGRFPNSSDLDEVTTSHPVILERSDGHAVVVNTRALTEANITADTENPFGGAINRDASGKATGMLVDNAGKLVEPLLPTLTSKRKQEAYIRGAELYASRGWTNIHSMSVDPADVPLLNTLARNKQIKIRVYNSLDLISGRAQTLANLTTLKNGENKLITTRAIKLYADGALGSRGAALLAPYSDDDKNSGRKRTPLADRTFPNYRAHRH